MMSGTDLIHVRSYLNYIVSTANSKGKGNVYFFEMSAQTGDLGIAIDYHPTVAQHLKNAKELIGYISTLKSWKANPVAFLGKAKLANDVTLTFNTELNDPAGNNSNFSVLCDNISLPVSSVTLSSTDKSELHLILSENFPIGKEITVSYLPGSVEAKNGTKLKAFSSFPVKNELTETKLTGGSVDVTGGKVTLTFNKKLSLTSNLDGISLFDADKNVLATSSFTCFSSNIEITLKNKITSGSKVYATLVSSVYGFDMVASSLVEAFLLTNKSKYTSVIENNLGKLLIYPNPSVNKIMNYHLTGDISGKVTASLFNMQGKILLSKELVNNSGVIDFNDSDIQRGSYILKVSASGKEFSKLISF
jgi:uncharacterized repeat protein (TIGR02059 family)